MTALRSRHEGRDMSDMDMSGMMTSGGYNNYALQQDFWILVGLVIAFATMINVLEYILLRQRLTSKSSKPTSLFWTSWATATAIGREWFGASQTSKLCGFRITTVVGPVSIVIAYSIAIIVFSYIGTDPSDSWNWEDVSVRIGCINQAQLPLIFLLAGKQNIIGWFTGIGYERLNWFHRWVARILWIGVTMHMGFFFRSWMRWNYIKVKLAEDNMTQTGFAGWCILTAIFILSFSPARRWNYELFIISHVILFAGLVGAVMIHVDSGTGYVWACVGLYLFDRTARFFITVFCNIGLFRGKSLWANHASLTPLAGNVTRISIDKPLVSWSPGQHMFLSCHTIVPLQSHPFTIASLPSDDKMEFIIQSKNGGTKRIFNSASRYEPLPSVSIQKRLVGIEGPYGYLRPLRQFDSVVLMAGSTGATFTVPLMRDLVHRWCQAEKTAITRSIRFVWAIKAHNRLSWFQSQLEQAMQDTESLRHKGMDVQLDISIYVTCDEELASGSASQHGSDSSRETEMLLDSDTDLTEKKPVTTAILESSNVGGCGSNNNCCCRSAVDEDSNNTVCCCSKISPSSPTTQADTRLRIFSGRPQSRNIIRKILEEAEGESAVVVCGPQGLREDVRRSVIGLSDERAVHKGSGAQGIYLHIEGFGY